MNIIPELNLNKHPNVIKNNSIVHAENIKLSNDSAILENDKVYERNTEILYLLEEIYGDERLIEYVLSCNRELILFTRATINDNILDIIRYDEITNKAKRVIDNFKYNGGKLLGTFTYNENNLIIAISEYFEDDSKNIPLKTLNLGKFSDNINIINKFHTIIPEVKIPSVNYNIINGFSYKGWYNVFIRYKLDDYDYTQWYNTNCSFLLDEYNNNSIIDYTITKATAKNFTTDENLLQNYPTVIKLNQYVSENKKLITYTANLNVSNLDSNYKNYQLAFIISSKEDIVGYSTKDININKTNYTINIKNCTKLDVSTIIKSFYNYYNVKTLDSVNNRLYIGNYNESLLEIDSNYELDVELKASSSDIKKIYNDDSSYKYIKVDALDDTYKFEYNEIDGNAIIYAYDFFSYNVLDLANGSKNIEYHKLNKDDTINVTLMHGFGQGSYAEPLGIVSVKNLYYNIRTKEYYINGTVIQHNENENQRLVYTLDQDTNTFSKSYIPVCQDYTYTVEEESYTTLNVTKTILNNNFIYPEQYYSFYIIFVDKYGHNYKPLKINNSNTNLSLINDLVRTPIISTNNTLSFKCKLKTFPANFVGYYVAYEQFESTIKLQGFGNKIDNKLIFYSDAINYKDSISINFTHVKVYAVENDPLTNEQGFLIDNNYRVKLNTDDDGQPSYSIFTIENKLLHVADTGNNILNSSNIELTILEDTFLDYGNDLYYCELINDNISELYNDENKTLIPCSKICYNVEEVIEINTKNAFIGNISALVVRNYFDDATCTYRELDSTLPGEGVYLFNLKHYVEVPNESIIINNAPTVKMFLDYDKSVKDAYK